MSALPPKADIRQRGLDVRFVPKADKVQGSKQRDVSRLQVLATELVDLKPDLVVVQGSAVLAALQHATRTLPITFAEVTDPVGQGTRCPLSAKSEIKQTTSFIPRVNRPPNSPVDSRREQRRW